MTHNFDFKVILNDFRVILENKNIQNYLKYLPPQKGKGDLPYFCGNI